MHRSHFKSLLAVLVMGCTDKSVEETGAPDTGTPESEETVDEPDEDAAIQGIWNARCISCHGEGTMVSEGLDLTDGHENMVGVTAYQWDMLLVAPGSTEESYLWYKLNDTQLSLSKTGLGVQMPMNSEPLTEEQLAQVEAWILEGAPD